MDVVINLIGIITLSCGEQVFGAPDPCMANFPKSIEMSIPDGRFNSRVCKENDTVDPVIRRHDAFIRVRGAAANASPWPGAIACSDFNVGHPCVLYPLRQHEITISHVTDGDGVWSMTNIGDFEDLRWRTHMPDLVLGSRRRVAHMTIRNGQISFHETENFQGMINSRITVTGMSGDIMIQASSAAGVRRLTVPVTASIDILNLPRAIALSDFKTLKHAHNDSDCDHFFLHYELATERPLSHCSKPDDGQCTTHKMGDPPLGGTISCSNSTYP